MTPLPLIDRHRVYVAASTEQVWDATLGRLHARTGFINTVPGALLAWLLVRSVPPRAMTDGEPTVEIAGFPVSDYEPNRVLRIEGQHRFAGYTMGFLIDPLDDEGWCCLSVETRAAFRGAGGRMYRAVLLRSGAHALAVKFLLLRVIARQAEQRSAA